MFSGVDVMSVTNVMNVMNVMSVMSVTIVMQSCLDTGSRAEAAG